MNARERGLCKSSTWASLASHTLLPWTLQDVRPTGHWLEIGGGAGGMADHLLDRYPDLRLTITDLDPEMIRAAAEQTDRHGDRVRTEVVDATQLPYADDTFDGTLNVLMLHHVLNWEEALREAVRVTRSGGLIVGFDLLKSVAARVLHLVDDSPHRLVDAKGLGQLVTELPIEVDRLQVLPFAAATRFTFRVV